MRKVWAMCFLLHFFGAQYEELNTRNIFSKISEAAKKGQKLSRERYDSSTTNAPHQTAAKPQSTTLNLVVITKSNEKEKAIWTAQFETTKPKYTTAALLQATNKPQSTKLISVVVTKSDEKLKTIWTPQFEATKPKPTTAALLQATNKPQSTKLVPVVITKSDEKLKTIWTPQLEATKPKSTTAALLQATNKPQSTKLVPVVVTKSDEKSKADCTPQFETTKPKSTTAALLQVTNKLQSTKVIPVVITKSDEKLKTIRTSQFETTKPKSTTAALLQTTNKPQSTKVIPVVVTKLDEKLKTIWTPQFETTKPKSPKSALPQIITKPNKSQSEISFQPITTKTQPKSQSTIDQTEAEVNKKLTTTQGLLDVSFNSLLASSLSSQATLTLNVEMSSVTSVLPTVPQVNLSVKLASSLVTIVQTAAFVQSKATSPLVALSTTETLTQFRVQPALSNFTTEFIHASAPAETIKLTVAKSVHTATLTASIEPQIALEATISRPDISNPVTESQATSISTNTTKAEPTKTVLSSQTDAKTTTVVVRDFTTTERLKTTALLKSEGTTTDKQLDILIL